MNRLDGKTIQLDLCLDCANTAEAIRVMTGQEPKKWRAIDEGLPEYTDKRPQYLEPHGVAWDGDMTFKPL